MGRLLRSNVDSFAGVAALVALVLIAGIPAFLSTPARGAPIALWGSATSGWGFTDTSMSSPGPLLVVTQGERVDLLLFSGDGAPHTWCIDYDGSGTCGAGENQSASFSDTFGTPWTFYPTGSQGTHTYICGVHGGFIMNGPIRIDPAVKPVVGISSPTGSQRWTGGSTHSIIWTMTDPQDPVTSLQAWVNYTTGGPWNPIAGPIQGTSNPHSVSWLLPVLSTPSASVNVTVVDPAGNRVSAVRAVPVIDSQLPSVVGMAPVNGSTGISTAANVIATFDEAMNRSATGAPMSAGIQDLSTSLWISVTYNWTGMDRVLTLDPAANLAPNTQHRAVINSSAVDASDPGNSVGTVVSWVFTTGCCADLVRPQLSNVVASPAVAESGTPVNVTATITDNDQVASGYVNVTLPDLSRLNHSMAIVSGSTWAWSQNYSLLGNYQFVIDAVDLSGNWNRSAQGAFRVVDTTPPPTPSTPANITVATGAVEVAWSNVSAPDLQGYRLYRSTSRSGPFTRIGPPLIVGNTYVDHDVQPGTTYYYRVSSVDILGNESPQSPAGVATVPAIPSDYTWAIVGAAIIPAVVALLASLLIWRRRGKGGQGFIPPSSSEPDAGVAKPGQRRKA